MTARSEAYEQINGQLAKARRRLRTVLRHVEGFNEAHGVECAAEAFGPEVTELLEDTLARLRERLAELERALA